MILGKQTMYSRLEQLNEVHGPVIDRLFISHRIAQSRFARQVRKCIIVHLGRQTAHIHGNNSQHAFVTKPYFILLNYHRDSLPA